MSAQKVLDIARRNIGYKENPPNSNRTKFGAWYGMDREPWCAMFVSYCFYQAGLPLPATTPKGFAYCPWGVNWFKKQGRWYKKPQVGDVVFFRWSGAVAQHVGIVERVNPDGSIVTIEGNTSPSNNANGGAVMRRERKDNILGYGRPDWSKLKDTSNKKERPSWERIIALTTPYMQGEDIKVWQSQMVARGWDLDIDGIYGEDSYAAARSFQREKGLEVDGAIGPVTWAATWEAPIT